MGRGAPHDSHGVGAARSAYNIGEESGEWRGSSVEHGEGLCTAWGRKGAGHSGYKRRGRASAIGGVGGGLQSSAHDSLLGGGGRTTLDAQFLHFLFGFRPGSLQKICSLMYTLQIVYRD
jgi:hypothetical protein